MTIKIKVSYEHEQERDRFLRPLQPILDKAKVKGPVPSGNGRYKTLYIQLGKTAGEDP